MICSAYIVGRTKDVVQDWQAWVRTRVLTINGQISNHCTDSPLLRQGRSACAEFFILYLRHADMLFRLYSSLCHLVCYVHHIFGSSAVNHGPEELLYNY